MNNNDIVKRYFNKYFKPQYFKSSDDEFKAFVRILNKKDRQVKNLTIPVVSGSTDKYGAITRTDHGEDNPCCNCKYKDYTDMSDECNHCRSNLRDDEYYR